MESALLSFDLGSGIGSLALLVYVALFSLDVVGRFPIIDLVLACQLEEKSGT